MGIHAGFEDILEQRGISIDMSIITLNTYRNHILAFKEALCRLSLSRKFRRRIFPLGLLGMASKNSTPPRKALYADL